MLPGTRFSNCGHPVKCKISGLDLLVTIRLAAIHCLGGSFLPVDGMPSRILTSDHGQGPQPRSGPPTAAALRVTAGRGTMQRPSGGHRTSDSGRHVKFRRPTHIKASLALQLNGLSRNRSSRAARVPAGSVVLSEVETSLAPRWCQKAAGSQCNRRSPFQLKRHTWHNAKSPAASSRQGTRRPLDQQRILAMVLVLKRLWACPWPLHWTI